MLMYLMLKILLLYIIISIAQFEVPTSNKFHQVYCQSSSSSSTKSQSAKTTATTTSIKTPNKHKPSPLIEQNTYKLTNIPQRFSRPIDGERGITNVGNDNNHYLPAGPPPFRPPTLVLALNNGLKKLKFNPTMKLNMQRRKIYYTFLDITRILHKLADQMAANSIKLTGTKLNLLKSAISKIALIGGKSLKLKWPLVMLNPHFLKELLANPTFLVMLFHAIEVGYMSSPMMNFWLKPLVELVKQPSIEKEEQSWWKRKRLYEAFNGIGSSELQPNLKTVHFRKPGKPQQVSIPALSQLFPNFYDQKLIPKQPDYHDQPQHQPQYYQQQQQQPTIQELHHYTPEHQQHHLVQVQSIVNEPISESDHWPPAGQMMMMTPTEQQELLSQEEFDALDESEKERIFYEAKQNLEESLWTNELIQKQKSFVDSLQNKLDNQSSSSDLDDNNISSNIRQLKHTGFVDGDGNAASEGGGGGGGDNIQGLQIDQHQLPTYYRD